MTNEEKETLFIDLCGRVPYMVKIQILYGSHPDPYELYAINLKTKEIKFATSNREGLFIGDANFIYRAGGRLNVKPYLRPMSSMTEEEITEYWKLEGLELDYADPRYPLKGVGHITWQTLDWLNAHHFDYRGLISMGLALKAPEGMYK